MYPLADDFDPALLDTRLDGTAVKVELSTRRGRRAKHYMPALSQAVFRRLVQLPRRAWAVYCAILLRCRLTRSQTVTLTSCFLSGFGLTRHDKAHALGALETAALIHVQRQPRRNPIITVLPMPEES